MRSLRSLFRGDEGLLQGGSHADAEEKMNVKPEIELARLRNGVDVNNKGASAIQGASQVYITTGFNLKRWEIERKNCFDIMELRCGVRGFQ